MIVITLPEWFVNMLYYGMLFLIGFKSYTLYITWKEDKMLMQVLDAVKAGTIKVYNKEKQ